MIGERFVRFTASCVLTCLTLIGGVEAVGTSDEDLMHDVVAFGLGVEASIETARYNVDRGTLDRAALGLEAERASAIYDGLERRVAALPEGPSDRLTRKLDAVGSLVANLNRAAEIGAAPTHPRDVFAPVRYPDRGGSSRAAPANDDCADAFVVGLGTYVSDTTDATNDGEALCGASLYSPDVWFRFVVPEYGAYMVDTMGSAFDTVVSVHGDCPGTINNQFICNDDYVGLQSVVTFTGYSGNEYLIRVSGSNGATGPYQLTISRGGTIAGNVSRIGSGEPVSTTVEIFDAESFYRGSDYTDSNGDYTVGLLGPGDFYVATDGSPDAVDEIYDDHSCPGGVPYGCEAVDGDSVPVVVGSTTAGIDFELEEGASISGVVTDEDSGLPLESVRIRLYSENGSYQTYRYTDESGIYAFANLAGGAYRLLATSGLYGDELYDDVPCPNNCSVLNGAVVVADIGAPTTGIDFALERLGEIRGVVTDRATGSPIAGADVRVMNSSGSIVSSVDAGSDGAYVAGGLYDGAYFVKASNYYRVPQLFDGVDCGRSGCDLSVGTPVVISDHTTVGGIDFDLSEFGSVTGQVLDAVTAQPLSSVVVRLYDDSGSSVSYDATDSSGIFDLGSVYGGAYFVATNDSAYVNQLYDGLPCSDGCDPTTGTPVTVINGQSTSGIDFEILPRGAITGTVTDDGTGESVTKRVNLYSSDGSYVKYDTSYGGAYEFYGLADGQYYVVTDTYYSYDHYLDLLYDGVGCWAGYPGGCDLADGTPVTAAVGAVTTGIDFSLPKKGSITGTVVDAGTQAGVDGRVYLIPADGSSVRYDSMYSGAYQFYSLLPGYYRMVADGAVHRDKVYPDVQCEGEYPDHCDLSPGAFIEVRKGDEIVIDMEVDALGEVTGFVQAASDGTPLNYFNVGLYDLEGERLRSDSTDSSGEFVIEGIWPGEYLVATYENSIDFVDELYDGVSCQGGLPNGCDPTAGTPVDIDLGTTATVSFDLGGTSSISGRVTDAETGIPMSGIYIEAWVPSGNRLRYTSTDSSGQYTIRGLGEGTYFIASDEYPSYSMTYVDMLYDGIACPSGPPEGCDPTKGTPVELGVGQQLRFIDLGLPRRASGLSGTIINQMTGDPISGIQVDVWDVSDGEYAAGASTTDAGTYVVNLNAGTYVVATDNPDGWANQIWDGHPCPFGSAYNGDCAPLLGSPVEVETLQLTEGIDFALVASGLVFGDGFESGDTASWSTTTP